MLPGSPVRYSGGDVLDLGVCPISLSVAVVNTKSSFREERLYSSSCPGTSLHHQGKPGQDAGAEAAEEAAYWRALWLASSGSCSASFLTHPRTTCSAGPCPEWAEPSHIKPPPGMATGKSDLHIPSPETPSSQMTQLCGADNKNLTRTGSMPIPFSHALPVI